MAMKLGTFCIARDETLQSKVYLRAMLVMLNPRPHVRAPGDVSRTKSILPPTIIMTDDLNTFVIIHSYALRQKSNRQ